MRNKIEEKETFKSYLMHTKDPTFFSFGLCVSIKMVPSLMHFSFTSFKNFFSFSYWIQFGVDVLVLNETLM